ncbi:MAG: hypothetical protein GX220_04325 [Treponema sp.]|nr:hypothetical protein [Treponema sp.]
MTLKEWNAFCLFRDEFCFQVEQWKKEADKMGLSQVQKIVAKNDNVSDYPIENIVVYNTELNKVTKDCDIKLIIIGDNPGKEEQLSKNQKYLVGLAGKIAYGYFKKNVELDIDFRKNTIILNKTPIHSAKTKQLTKMLQVVKKQDENLFIALKNMLVESQKFMAEKTAKLHSVFAENNTELWLVGYSELKNNGIFEIYRDKLRESYKKFKNAYEKVYIFQHFSMNRFAIDLRENYNENISLKENIKILGNRHKIEILGE